jgi:putative ABC transport system permease protein
VIGLIAAAGSTRVLRGLLFETAPLDPWTFSLTAVLLLIVATVASYLPARRSTRLAPLDAIRTN